MTRIARVYTEEGIVLSGDSRSTFVYEDGRPSDWQDVTQKVFQVGSNVGIAFSGFTYSDTPRIHIPSTLQEFARQFDPMQTYDPADIRQQLAETIEQGVAFVNSAYRVVASQTQLVRGPVDMLVLRPEGATWRQRKLV